MTIEQKQDHFVLQMKRFLVAALLTSLFVVPVFATVNPIANALDTLNVQGELDYETVYAVKEALDAFYHVYGISGPTPVVCWSDELNTTVNAEECL